MALAEQLRSGAPNWAAIERKLTMVPTTSISPDLNFKATDLRNSEFEQDRTLFEQVRNVMGDLVTKLVPIIQYIDQDNGSAGRSIVVCTAEGKYKLLLSRAGKWHYDNGSGDVSESGDAWTYFNFTDIAQGLEKAFWNATKKKEEHLAAVAKRTDLLQRVGAVIRGEAVAATEK